MPKSQKGLAPILIIFLIALAVGGYLLYSNYSDNQTKTVSVLTTTNTAPVATSSAETVNWKIYKTEKYNFSMKYPNNWQTYAFNNVPKDEPLDETPKRYFASIDTNQKILLEIIPYNPELFSNTITVRDIVNSLLDPNDKNTSISGMLVDGFDAQVVENPNGMPKVAVVFNYGNFIYKFQTDDNLKDELVKMLSTFQFGGPRTGSKIYISTALGFTVQYSARWDITERNVDETGSFFAYRVVSFSPPANSRSGYITVYVSRKDYQDNFPNYKENFTVSGIPAYRVSPPPGRNAPYEDIAFKKDNIYFIIERLPKESVDDAAFDNFLSTFRFTDKNINR